MGLLQTRTSPWAIRMSLSRFVSALRVLPSLLHHRNWKTLPLYCTVCGTASDYVLDASVILKWFLTTEREASLAGRVKLDLQSRKIKAYIPRFALIEVLNVLSLKPPYKGDASYTKAEIDKVIPKGRITQKRLSDGDLMRALEIVTASGLVFYDALYIALAERLKTKYLTADYKASARLSGRGDVVELRAY